jgi:hypothetical protein
MSLSTLFSSFFICEPVLVLSIISSQHSDTVQLNLVVEYTQKWPKTINYFQDDFRFNFFK